ncbi:ribosomal protein S18-alanine N-acetyltransferase [Marinobacter bryozoorum]|jgi:ribosomal-protein-alanine N-acetyltransferase|uniref:ribosomal protein S18-alanine N-acetyltransferase n=1 Tax=Marinobacter bryozoorum TaxID=256324 RepID=UPI002004A2A2|nr:ribosomal protein S18-alanine N-acetyltransferase [Marinobacter bryozoorum]MCK7543847.1 ribosomal protein S18-alanine N-acetyltransferase [Marinobacter bryozoorum]
MRLPGRTAEHYPAVRVRPLVQGDLPAILDIEHQGYSHPWSEGVFRDAFRSGYQVIGIEQAGRLEGYAVLATLFDEAHLLNLCTRPASRGLGYGRRLLRELLMDGARRGLQRLVLEVRVSNQPARHLYQSEGFVVVGKRPGYYPDGAGREDAVVMALGLAGPADPTA